MRYHAKKTCKLRFMSPCFRGMGLQSFWVLGALVADVVPALVCQPSDLVEAGKITGVGQSGDSSDA